MSGCRGCGQAHHPFPSRSQTTCRRGFVFQRVDWTLIHHFGDRTRIHSKPSGGSLKTFFIVFYGGCQTGFRQCERQGMCITSCLSASASKHVCSPCMSWPFRGPCVCVWKQVCSSWKGLHSQPLAGGQRGCGGALPIEAPPHTPGKRTCLSAPGPRCGQLAGHSFHSSSSQFVLRHSVVSGVAAGAETLPLKDHLISFSCAIPVVWHTW